MNNIHIKKCILNIIIAISSVLLLVCAAKIFSEAEELKRQEALKAELAGHEKAFDDRTQRGSLPLASQEALLQEPDELFPGFYKRLSDLKKENQDLQGWIYIEGIDLSLPVMQSEFKNRDFYLNRDFYGRKSKYGTLYMDSTCDRIIYGHNMKDGSMFGGLDRYADEGYMRRFPEVRLYHVKDDGKIISEKYEMVSSFTISEKKFKTEGFLKMIKGDTEKDKRDLLEYLKRANPVPISEKINDMGEFEFLLLVTCEYSAENGRLFAVAKKIS